MVVFLDIKAAFDSVDREVLWQCLSLKGVPKKYINLIQALYSNTTDRVRVYGELSSELIISSGVRQGCPLSSFLFNFVVNVLLEITLSSSKFPGVELLPGGSLVDLEYADNKTGNESRARRFIGSSKDETITKCFISPAHPNLVALGTNGSAVYLADLRSLEKISVMRASGITNSICFTQDGTFLNTYGAEGSIYVFDLRVNKARIIHRWFDQASTNGLSISSSPNSQWIACG
ncbi:unnamed protein product [Schistosoma margrebowiei]|uniref:Uncharacterized protein n=1 Tax=Schistosoma margrebowiei TaxID=48269 RepID=A0A183M626_9TREM|nr:unnamed protein product [Schistosoma margrebowiei]